MRQKILLEQKKQTMSYENAPSGRREKEGKLICKKKRTYFQYYIGNRYISKKKNMEQIKDLAREEYRERLLPVIDSEIKALKRTLKTEQHLSEVYSRMNKGKQVLFTPDYLPLEMRIKNFEAEEYVGLEFKEDDHTEFITNRGERVRSKSEKIIADELDRWGIPYKYEKPLSLNIDGRNLILLHESSYRPLNTRVVADYIDEFLT
jgi:hypothetical protein